MRPAGEPWLRHICDERIGAFPVRHDLALARNWTVVFGPSGSGKSTWLRMLAGLLPQRTGSLRIHDTEIRFLRPHQRRVALVEQSPALFPHQNVECNVGFGCGADLVGKLCVPELLDAFRLIHLRRADVRDISGGERQRVAIARALGSHPQVLLLDEVFTGMDAALQQELVQVLRSYSERLLLPIVSVTHDVTEVFATADEVLRMNAGSIIAQGSAAEALRDERAVLLQQLRS